MEKEYNFEKSEIVRVKSEYEKQLFIEVMEHENIIEQTIFMIKSKYSNFDYKFENEYFIRTIVRGDGLFIYDNNSVKITKGDLIIVNPNQPHRIIMDDPEKSNVLTIWFDYERLNNIITAIKEKDSRLLNNPEISNTYDFMFKSQHYKNSMLYLGRLMFQFLDNNNDDDDIAINFIKEIYLHEFLYYLFKEELKNSTKLQTKKEIAFPSKEEIKKRMEIAKDFIYENINKKVTIEQLSNITGLSNSYFIILFKEYFGISPYQYLISVRMNIAKNLLKNTNISVKDIGTRIGYPTFQSFAKAFKLFTGSTPSEYRLWFSLKA